jgi:ATP-dependent Clp endopeptidase proteolytic subunit ClpP
MPDLRSRFRAFARADRQPVRAELPTVAGDSTIAVIRLYDPIDSWGEWYGISSKEFATVIDGLPDSIDTIRLLINSPGGEVWEGIAILNILRRVDARIEAVVEGVAASMASVIACGADELVMAPNSELMVHDVWAGVVGNAQDLRDTADDLDRLSDNIAGVYAAKAGGDVATWRAVMARETWYTAAEAVEAGLADRLDTTVEPDGDGAKARHDLSIYRYAGRATAPAPSSAVPPSPPPHTGQEGASTMELSEIREALGLADDSSDEDVLTAALDRLTAPPPAPVPAPLPDGVVTIDAAALAALQANAQAGVEARAEQLRQHRASLVDGAVADGRIAPVSRDAWLAQLEATPGSEEVLAGLAKGLIPTKELGTEAHDLEVEHAEYAALYGKEA